MPKINETPEDKRLKSVFNALHPIHTFPIHTQLYLLNRIAAYIHGEINHLMKQPADEAQPT